MHFKVFEGIILDLLNEPKFLCFYECFASMIISKVQNDAIYASADFISKRFKSWTCVILVEESQGKNRMREKEKEYA